jgi:hypothetical protein
MILWIRLRAPCLCARTYYDQREQNVVLITTH